MKCPIQNKDYMLDLCVRMAHHSTAIEGNTLTQDETASVILDGYIPRAIKEREFYEVRNYKNVLPALIEKLENKTKIDNAKNNEEKIYSIVKSHINFERIHSFSDDNGRTGRLLIMYSCLEQNLKHPL